MSYEIISLSCSFFPFGLTSTAEKKTFLENSAVGVVGLKNPNTNKNFLPGSEVRLNVKEAELMVY